MNKERERERGKNFKANWMKEREKRKQEIKNRERRNKMQKKRSKKDDKGDRIKSDKTTQN